MESGPIEQRPGNKVIGGFAAACGRALGFAWQHCGRNQKSTVIIAAAHGFRPRRTNYNISIPSISYTFIHHYRKHVSAQSPSRWNRILRYHELWQPWVAPRDFNCVHHDEGPISTRSRINSSEKNASARWVFSVMFQVWHSSWRLHMATLHLWVDQWYHDFMVSINFSVIGPLYKLLSGLIGNVNTNCDLRMLVRDAAVLSEAKCF